MELFAAEESAFREHRLSPRIQCPVCGYAGWSFHPFSSAYGLLRFNALCPRCDSLERHRLVKLVLDELGVARWQGRLLHFAPEDRLRSILRHTGQLQCFTVDLHRADVECRLDIQGLPFRDDWCSYILCSHVLEHVPRDEDALAELRRVLRPDGILVLVLPVEPGARTTIEYGAPLESAHGHLRAYGADFEERVARHFTVESRSAHERTVSEVLRFGLNTSDRLLVCR